MLPNRLFSPYQFNPFNYNPLRQVLAETVDFEATTISSRCHRSLGRGRTCRSRRAIIGPNFRTQLRTLS
jgi:hypothetical protein